MRAVPLRVDDLTAGYGRTEVISHVGFDVPAGGRTLVLGRNGVGKTTLLASLMGLCTQHGGTIRLGDEDLSGRKTSRRAMLGMGYVPQTRDIFRSLTVEQNLSTGIRSGSDARLEEAYNMFPRLAERRRNLGGQLSGGEQQMLSIARTLLGQPSVLLLDEPLEGLAPIICDELMATISDLCSSRAITIILVEQQIERALAFGEHALIIEKGQIAWEGAVAALKADHTLIETYLGVGIR
ncbi:MAG TPA: ABC transporter ATP-binding protein [Rhizobiaceae bacterium]|nr:ABC transporter ATP-binding protein [Rhizobiaceae bacterium]